MAQLNAKGSLLAGVGASVCCVGPLLLLVPGQTLLAILLVLPAAAWAGNPQTMALAVQNTTCSLCSITIQKALEKVPEVEAAQVAYGKKTATVTFDSDKSTPADLVKATTTAGFPSTAHQ